MYVTEEDSCSRCMFWCRFQKGKGGEVVPDGFCRIRAPVVKFHSNHQLWAITRYDDWCGEFKKKESND